MCYVSVQHTKIGVKKNILSSEIVPKPLSQPMLGYPLVNSLRSSDAYMRNLAIIGSYNGLASGRRQAIFWTYIGILLIQTLGTNFNEFLSEIHTFSWKKMLLQMPSEKCRQFCLGLNVLTYDMD